MASSQQGSIDLSIEDDQFEEPFNSKTSKESIERNTIDENQLDK